MQRNVYDMGETSKQIIFEQLQVDSDLEMSQNLLENIENAKMLYQTYRDNIKMVHLVKQPSSWLLKRIW